MMGLNVKRTKMLAYVLLLSPVLHRRHLLLPQ